MVTDKDEDIFINDDPMIVLLELTRLKNLRLVDLFSSLDTDKSWTLSREEFSDGLMVGKGLIISAIEWTGFRRAFIAFNVPCTAIAAQIKRLQNQILSRLYYRDRLDIVRTSEDARADLYGFPIQFRSCFEVNTDYSQCDTVYWLG